MASKKDPRGKYRAFKVRVKKLSGSHKILQPCLASIATLKAAIFLKPKPPFDFDGIRGPKCTSEGVDLLFLIPTKNLQEWN